MFHKNFSLEIRVLAATALGLSLLLAVVNAGDQNVGAHYDTVQGGSVDFEKLKQKRFILFFFSIQMGDLAECMRCYEEVHREGVSVQAEVIGVSIDRGQKHALRAFAKTHDITLPIIVDESGNMRQSYKPTAFPTSYFFSKNWLPLGTLPGFPDRNTANRHLLFGNLLRKRIGLGEKLVGDPRNDVRPKLGEFQVTYPDGSRFDSASLHGKTTIVTFVAEDCPYCADQLLFFSRIYEEYREQGLQFLCVLVSDDQEPEQFRQKRQLPFPVVGDRGGQLRRALGYRGIVPDNLVVDGEGAIRYRHTIFDGEQPPLYLMELRRLMGVENPPLLRASGANGVRSCLICHEEEYFHWSLTGHSNAMATLQRVGEDENAECLPCHVVGWDEPLGFNSGRGERGLELKDVQCESCHGDGGPHVGEARAIGVETCARCHDEKHSLDFRFEKSLPLVIHNLEEDWRDPQVLARLQEKREAWKRELLQPDGDYVGAAACQSCHAQQHGAWQKSPHGNALATLKGNDAAECLQCHNTGVGRSWSAEHASTSHDGTSHDNVQCESCHGPGSRHVAATTVQERRDTIIGLGAKCEKCVIEQVCRSCHDANNDPDFDLERALPMMQELCHPTSGNAQSRPSAGNHNQQR